MESAEKRQCRRRVARDVGITLRPLDPRVWFQFWSGTECEMRDISLVGAGIYSKDKIPEGTPLSVDIRLGKSADTIRIFGKIAWAHQENEQYRMGVSFFWWKEEEDKKIVDSFVERYYKAVN
ncbi:MAG: PilZ domain-containing protein [Candidatus Omnitrophica bacterium]|nr:PilZ domain-containing protein [Candidatus Omnitrophota bacterium]